jgi:hypothetical protein
MATTRAILAGLRAAAKKDRAWLKKNKISLTPGREWEQQSGDYFKRFSDRPDLMDVSRHNQFTPVTAAHTALAASQAHANDVQRQREIIAKLDQKVLYKIGDKVKVLPLHKRGLVVRITKGHAKRPLYEISIGRLARRRYYYEDSVFCYSTQLESIHARPARKHRRARG